MTMKTQKAVTWGLLVLAVLMSGASSLFELYDVFGWYDEVLHGYMSFALSLLLALYAYDTILTGRLRHEVLLELDGARLRLGARAPALSYTVTGNRRVYFADDTGIFEAWQTSTARSTSPSCPSGMGSPGTPLEEAPVSRPRPPRSA